jgi:hypothetical protein
LKETDENFSERNRYTFLSRFFEYVGACANILAATAPGEGATLYAVRAG